MFRRRPLNIVKNLRVRLHTPAQRLTLHFGGLRKKKWIAL